MKKDGKFIPPLTKAEEIELLDLLVKELKQVKKTKNDLRSS